MGRQFLTRMLPAPGVREASDTHPVQGACSTWEDSQVLISEWRLLPQPPRGRGLLQQGSDTGLKYPVWMGDGRHSPRKVGTPAAPSQTRTRTALPACTSHTTTSGEKVLGLLCRPGEGL